jgi:DNA repair photolyase
MAITKAAAKRHKRLRRQQRPPLPLTLPLQPPAIRLPQLVPVTHEGTVLRPSPLTELVGTEVCSLNLTTGCPVQCAFCFTRAYPNYPGEEFAYFHEHTAERLRKELLHRRHLPRAVHISPSTDPFPPYLMLQREVGRVLDVLAEFGVQAWFMTRGYIRPFLMDMLGRHPELVRVTIAISTVNSRLRRVLEPLAAPPRMRLKQLGRLREMGIKTQVAVEPLIPGLTDTRANLEPLLDELVKGSVTHITAAYMFLRHGMEGVLERDLGPLGWSKPIMEAFQGGPVLAMGSIAPAQHLPRHYRQNGYALLMSLASQRGITTSVSGLTNPDFKPPRIPVVQRNDPPYRQLELL